MKTKKILVSLLALCMAVVLLASCNPSATTQPSAGPSGSTGELKDLTDGLEALDASKKIYDANFGEFLALYNDAKENSKSVSERYAKMAIAEAKLLQLATFLPMTAKGGNYAISRVAPYTIDYANWGSDNVRFHQALVIDGAPLLAEHRNEMKAKWGELKGTGTYEAWAKEYLAGKGYKLKDSYTLPFTSNVEIWDALATSYTSDTEALVNTIDGLYEYDIEGVHKPALAESYTISEDGKTYTIKLREGVHWVDSEKRDLGELTAEDFVAGFQHMLDAAGGNEYLVQGVIKGANEYIAKTNTDFSTVGVKAADKYTLVYELESATPYFPTMWAYNIFEPMCKSYYEQMGGKFGTDFDATAESYKYGKGPDSIAYCGPYVISGYVKDSSVTFTANPSYWNKDNINVKTINWKFYDGKDPLATFNDMMAGTLDGAGLNPSALVSAKETKVDGTDKSWYDVYGYISAPDTTAYVAFYNLNRTAFANYDNADAMKSTLSAMDQIRAKYALNNVHFRRALSFSINRVAYNAAGVGEDLAPISLINSFTPGDFVSMEEEVTVKINGKDMTYPAGTFYGKIMQDQIDADGTHLKVWDPTAEGGAGSSKGFDGWYSAEAAVEELNKAIDELKAQGVEVSAEKPIVLDYPVYAQGPVFVNRANAVKKSVEDALGGKIKIMLVNSATQQEYLAATYRFTSGEGANYHINTNSGWGPDYGDPSTYLDTLLPDGAGYMTKSFGLY